MTPKKYKHSISVPETAIDDMQHVNNVTYLQWCVDAAAAHWVSKTSESIREKYVWVVLNHTISYRSPAFKGDQLEIKTWVEKLEGVKSERRYEILRKKDSKTIVEAKSVWCLLDGKTHRPLKINDEISTLFL